MTGTINQKAILTGFFSTVGDIECLEVVQKWLSDQNIDFDVVPYHDDIVPFISGSKYKSQIDPNAYTHLVVICGPCWPTVFSEMKFDIHQFSHCVKIGINLTMIVPVSEWNPFDVLIERDSERASRPDLSFCQKTDKVPVVGLCFIQNQGEYGTRQKHDFVIKTVKEFCQSRNIATVNIDTRWPKHRNDTSLESKEQISSVLQKVDMVITNRLHGLVFSIKVGTPVIAIDGVTGGDKLIKQAQVLNWPASMVVDHLSEDIMQKHFDWCLSADAKNTIQNIAAIAAKEWSALQSPFMDSFITPPTPKGLPANTPHYVPEKVGFARKSYRKIKAVLMK